MTYLTMGPFSLPIAWLAFFLAIFYSDRRSKGEDVATSRVIGQLFWVYIVVWKGSYVLFFGDSFWQAPLSLLYFDGGWQGHGFAALVCALLIVKHRHVLDWDIIWRYGARLVASSQFVTLLFSEQWLPAILWLAVLIAVEWNWRLWLLTIQWALLIWLNGWLDAYLFMHALIMVSVMMKKRARQFAALTAVLTLIALAVADFRSPSAIVERQPIDLRTTEHTRYSVAEQELTIVNFFATWCPPCQAEMPHLQSFSENLPDGVALIGVNLTSRDNGAQALEAFLAKYQVTYPILLDETDAFGQGYEVMSIPTTVLLRDGQELARVVGPVSEQVLREMVKKYD